MSKTHANWHIKVFHWMCNTHFLMLQVNLPFGYWNFREQNGKHVAANGITCLYKIFSSFRSGFVPIGRAELNSSPLGRLIRKLLYLPKNSSNEDMNSSIKTSILHKIVFKIYIYDIYYSLNVYMYLHFFLPHHVLYIITQFLSGGCVMG